MRNRDLYFMTIAHAVAYGSKDPSTQVGAIIVKDDTIISTGFNGLPRGFSKDHDKEYWMSPKKYDYVVHGEINAIINAGRSNGNTIGATMYSTFFPCHKCAPAIINAGIVRVVSPLIKDSERDLRWKQSMDISFEMFNDVGMKLYFISV